MINPLVMSEVLAHFLLVDLQALDKEARL
jgi:hypothetical protein